MQRAFRNALLGTCLVLAVIAWGAPVNACPMCAETAAADKALPRAFMWSIIFMLSVPASVASGLGIVVYRVVRRHDAYQTARLGSGAVDAGVDLMVGDTNAATNLGAKGTEKVSGTCQEPFSGAGLDTQ